MSRGDEESATTYARLLQEELDKAENLSAQFQKNETSGGRGQGNQGKA